MEKCLHCRAKLTHVPGRKQKSFCNVNCRNKYFYAQRRSLVEATKQAVADLPKEFGEIKTIGTLDADGEIVEVATIVPSANEKIISELEKELKTVPDSGLGKKRRQFLQSKISELKR